MVSAVSKLTKAKIAVMGQATIDAAGHPAVCPRCGAGRHPMAFGILCERCTDDMADYSLATEWSTSPKNPGRRAMSK